MTKKDNDPFGFNKAINWDKLEDPKVLKELEKLFDEEEKKEDEQKNFQPGGFNKPLALAQRQWLQEGSGKLQATSSKLDKKTIQDYKGV